MQLSFLFLLLLLVFNAPVVASVAEESEELFVRLGQLKIDGKKAKKENAHLRVAQDGLKKTFVCFERAKAGLNEGEKAELKSLRKRRKELKADRRDFNNDQLNRFQMLVHKKNTPALLARDQKTFTDLGLVPFDEAEVDPLTLRREPRTKALSPLGCRVFNLMCTIRLLSDEGEVAAVEVDEGTYNGLLRTLRGFQEVSLHEESVMILARTFRENRRKFFLDYLSAHPLLIGALNDIDSTTLNYWKPRRVIVQEMRLIYKKMGRDKCYALGVMELLADLARTFEGNVQTLRATIKQDEEIVTAFFQQNVDPTLVTISAEDAEGEEVEAPQVVDTYDYTDAEARKYLIAALSRKADVEVMKTIESETTASFSASFNTIRNWRIILRKKALSEGLLAWDEIEPFLRAAEEQAIL
jgi:hypothetical protein